MKSESRAINEKKFSFVVPQCPPRRFSEQDRKAGSTFRYDRINWILIVSESPKLAVASVTKNSIGSKTKEQRHTHQPRNDLGNEVEKGKSVDGTLSRGLSFLMSDGGKKRIEQNRINTTRLARKKTNDNRSAEIRHGIKKKTFSTDFVTENQEMVSIRIGGGEVGVGSRFRNRIENATKAGIDEIKLSASSKFETKRQKVYKEID